MSQGLNWAKRQATNVIFSIIKEVKPCIHCVYKVERKRGKREELTEGRKEGNNSRGEKEKTHIEGKRGVEWVLQIVTKK